MSRKRKSEEATPLDEADRTLYSTFRGAANSLSQLYTQAMHNQTPSFHAGERHALEKLYQWILRRHEIGSRVTVSDIVTHIQNRMDYGGEDASATPRLALQQQTQSSMHFMNSSIQPSSGLFGHTSTGFVPCASNSDQAKDSVFSNALSSPIQGNLQHYHLAQGSGYYANGLPTGNGGTGNHDPNQHQDLSSLKFNDLSMDVHPDSPTHGSH